MTAPDPTLSAAILGAVARTRVEADFPAAILAAIGETHVVIARDRWERVRVAAQLANCYGCFEPGDLDDN